MKKNKIIATGLAIAIMVTGCGSTKTAQSPAPAANEDTNVATQAPVEKDKVVALLPPVSPNYQEKFDEWIKEFNDANPDIELSIDKASWEDMTSKLDVQVQAGSPPDIAFIGGGGVPKYLDTGLIVEVGKYATPEMLADYDQDALNYFKNGDKIYGLPAYMDVQAIGGDKTKLEAAGIDWKKVQQEGWTYEEFREAIKNGTVTKDGKTTYGFVFACSGVTAIDYFSIFSKNAGMPSPFTTDLKYAYTSKNTLNLLKDMRQLIDDGSMPAALNSVDGGKRWNMFLTDQTMITGKGLSIFESMARKNNEKIDANDGSAVKDSVKTDYIVLPVPTFDGNKQQAQATVDGYIALRGKEEPTDEHLTNVIKAMYFLNSGERAAFTDAELFCNPVCKTAEEVYVAQEGKSEENTQATKILAANAAPARPDIPAELGAKADIIMKETIVPKFQGLLAGEITPEEMYEEINKAAIAEFGADGVVVD